MGSADPWSNQSPLFEDAFAPQAQQPAGGLVGGPGGIPAGSVSPTNPLDDLAHKNPFTASHPMQQSVGAAGAGTGRPSPGLDVFAALPPPEEMNALSNPMVAGSQSGTPLDSKQTGAGQAAGMVGQVHGASELENSWGTSKGNPFAQAAAGAAAGAAAPTATPSPPGLTASAQQSAGFANNRNNSGSSSGDMGKIQLTNEGGYEAKKAREEDPFADLWGAAPPAQNQQP